VQTQSLLSQQFSFYLSSQRKIDSIFVQCSYPISQVSNTGNSAYVSISTEQQEANSNYLITYVLDASQLGLFSYSTFQPQGSLPDSLGRGFFSFIAEPDPSVSTSTISKVFTLIVDRSGSMSYESKMDQAKQAATYIVQNLNEGDKFNVIDFDDIITCLQPNHVAYSPETKAAAIAYIQNLYARGNTSISGAFGTAVPQFTSANDSTANIIMFLTDGQPTADIINTDALVNYVTQLITNSGRKIYTYCFGIGSDVNTQLLTLLASNNNGFATILSNNELYATVTDFYNSIRNPVLLSPKLSFSPAVVSQVYPDSLSNLYKGNQLIAAGRYSEAVKVQATFSGKAFNKDVTYQYMLDLSDSLVVENQFMTKLWAKKKIESLLIKYYRLDANSSEAAAIKDQITKLSIAYRVITPFTSFSGGYIGTGIETKHGANKNLAPTEFELLGNYPNPFNPNTIIRIRVNSEVNTVFEIRIYSITGELVKIIPLPVHGKGDYRVSWDGTNMFGKQVASGIYIYSVTGMNQIMTKKMMFLR
jgi:Ca-activated chloride channel family protein